MASESSVVGEQNWASDCNPCVSSFIFLYLSFPRAYPTLTKTHLSCPLSQIRSCISSRTGPRSSTLFRDRIRSDIRTRLGPASLGCGFPGFPSAFVAARLFECESFLAPRFPDFSGQFCYCTLGCDRLARFPYLGVSRLRYHFPLWPSSVLRAPAQPLFAQTS